MHTINPAIRGPRLTVGVARLITVIAYAMMLAACSTDRELITPADVDYRLRHNIAITEGPHSIVLFIGSSRGGLNGEQRADVLAFANSWRREATGGVLIDLPSGTRNEVAAASALREVRAILTAAGVPPSAVGVRPYRPADPSKLATMRLNYPTLVAQAGPCGLWPEDLGPSIKDRGYIENKPYYNFGCAFQRNMAAMVEQPSDLLQPRPETPAYTARRTEGFDKYRKGTSTSTIYPEAEKAKLSDTGK